MPSIVDQINEMGQAHAKQYVLVLSYHCPGCGTQQISYVTHGNNEAVVLEDFASLKAKLQSTDKLMRVQAEDDILAPTDAAFLYTVSFQDNKPVWTLVDSAVTELAELPAPAGIEDKPLENS